MHVSATEKKKKKNHWGKANLNLLNDARASQQVHGASHKPHDFQAQKVFAHREIPTVGLSCWFIPSKWNVLTPIEHLAASFLNWFCKIRNAVV